MPANVFESEMTKTFGWDKKNNTINAIPFTEYAKNMNIGVPQGKTTGNIAVVVVQGAIVDGPDARAWPAVILSPHNSAKPV